MNSAGNADDADKLRKLISTLAEFGKCAPKIAATVFQNGLG